MNRLVVATFYQFVELSDYQDLRWPLRSLCLQYGMRGTLLLTPEGVNGTVAGTRAGINAILEWFKADGRLDCLEYKESSMDTENNPFYRMKVKLKKEVVTFGIPGISPKMTVGYYVRPENWNELILDPDTTTIDTRNNYEVEVGSFKGAINPGTKKFREFPKWVDENLDPRKHKTVAMFCTGGIRCEKATSYLLERGFENVFHLKGGILNYLKKANRSTSLWEGECFVFDNRVTVNHESEPGHFDQCHACRRPITEGDKLRPEFIVGVQCNRCMNEHSETQRERFRMRQKQIALAESRGERHIGLSYDSIAERQQKKQAKRALTKEKQLQQSKLGQEKSHGQSKKTSSGHHWWQWYLQS